VISRTSIAKYTSCSGNQALITARLRDAHLANHLWSEA
jgi:hypothetical protein